MTTQAGQGWHQTAQGQWEPRPSVRGSERLLGERTPEISRICQVKTGETCAKARRRESEACASFHSKLHSG